MIKVTAFYISIGCSWMIQAGHADQLLFVIICDYAAVSAASVLKGSAFTLFRSLTSGDDFQEAGFILPIELFIV